MSSAPLRLSKETIRELRRKYPKKFPVVIETLECGLELKKRKFLVASSTTMGELLLAIRRYSELEAHQALFVYVDNTLVPTSSLVYQFWEKHAKDDCLYLQAAKENTFG